MNMAVRTSGYFDRKAVIDAVGKVAAKNLSKGGAFIRRTDRQSMPIRKGPSTAGRPPHSHSAAQQAKAGKARRGPLIKKMTDFRFDTSTKSMVVGAWKLGRSNAPEIVEKGGIVRVRRVKRTAGKPMSPKQRAAFERKKKDGTLSPRKRAPVSSFGTATVAARPHVGPALEKEIRAGTLAGVWANTVK